MSARDRLAFALDYPTLAEATEGAERVCASAGVLKVGLELFVKEGPQAVRIGARVGCDVFLDLKLHDIPKTVERAVGTAASLGARYLTLHAAGGAKMMEAATRRAEAEGTQLTLLAVTVLTSLDEADLRGVGVSATPAEQALRLAKLAMSCGVRGLVCSVQEVATLRAELGPGAVLVTPGIRPASESGVDDQKRTGTPTAAIRSGSSLLVVGRPIRDAEDPTAAAARIVDEIARAV